MMTDIPVFSTDDYGIYWFNPSNANMVFQKTRDEEEINKYKCAGWGSKIRSINGREHSVVIYVQSGKLYLQIDLLKWDLNDPKVKLEISRRFILLINSFRVCYDNQVQLKCDYWSYLIKPSYLMVRVFDGVDEEDEDFLFDLAKNFNKRERINRAISFIERYGKPLV